MPVEFKFYCASSGYLELIITSFVIISGWIVVHFLGNISRKSEHHRSLLDKAKSIIKEIEVCSVDYHTSKSSTGTSLKLKSESSILSMLNELDWLLIIVFKNDSPNNRINESISSSFVEFRKSVTLINFQTNRKTQYEHDSELIRNIKNTSLDLTQKIEDKYESTFKASVKDFFC